MDDPCTKLYAQWGHIAEIVSKRFLCKNPWIPAHERNDYKQEARLALWNALSGDKVDLGRSQASISSYLMTRTYGAMYDYLRRTNAAARQNRSAIKTKFRKASAAITARGDEVTSSALAIETGLSGVELAKLIKHGTNVRVREVDVDDVVLRDDSELPFDALENKEMREAAGAELSRLTGRDRAVADMLCLGARQEDIASCLGVTTSRVSQIKAKICTEIRARLEQAR